MDKNRETRSIKGKLDETRKVSLFSRGFEFHWERERGRSTEKDVEEEVLEVWEIGRESWWWKGWSRREWIRGGEIFGEEMRNFSKRFLFVRAAVSCRPAGWNRAENYVLNWLGRRKEREKRRKGWGGEYRTTVACFRRLTVAPWFHLAGIEAIRSSPSKLWEKYLQRGGKGMEFLPQFFSRNRANFCVEQIILSFWKT